MAFATNYAVGTPYGTITIWYGAVNAVPNGWHLCDGAGGTPDLRDRFIVGAGSSYGKGATGGEAGHTLAVDELAGHAHQLLHYAGGSMTGLPGLTFAADHPDTENWVSGYISSVGSNNAHENRPPYYALAYIMKV